MGEADQTIRSVIDSTDQHDQTAFVGEMTGD